MTKKRFDIKDLTSSLAWYELSPILPCDISGIVFDADWSDRSNNRHY
jgi:hypothetical protein